MKYYVDTRTMTVVSEEHLSKYLAPECFYEYAYTESNTIIEKYRVEDNKYLEYSHLIGDDKHLVCREREQHFKNNNCDLNTAVLVKYTVPQYLFEDVLRECGYIK